MEKTALWISTKPAGNLPLNFGEGLHKTGNQGFLFKENIGYFKT